MKWDLQKATVCFAACMMLAGCEGSVTPSDSDQEPDEDQSVPCQTGLVDCGGQCVDIMHDGDHCGACYAACPDGFSCSYGTCVPSCASTCNPPRECCGETCTYTASDRSNCGTCGHVCPPETDCMGGVCTVNTCDPACAGGTACCAGECADLQADFEHCGYCDHACDAVTADACVLGYCSCRGARECVTGQKCCADLGCRNIMTDPSNCGDCGAMCPIGESCVDGECACDEGLVCTDSQACCLGVCVDIMHDPENCGGCGRACSERGPDCVGGQCLCGSSPECPWGGMLQCVGGMVEQFQMCCSGECVEESVESCGGCGIACGLDEACTGAMEETECIFTCGPPP